MLLNKYEREKSIDHSILWARAFKNYFFKDTTDYEKQGTKIIFPCFLKQKQKPVIPTRPNSPVDNNTKF